MELSLWTYEGPPHVGAIRIANSMRGVHLMLHAPQGDSYADLLFTMIERDDHRPPVTYTTFQARDLGSDTAQLVLRTLSATVERHKPQVLLVGDSCTAELIQDQPGSLATSSGLDVPIIPVEMLAYSRKENWGAGETFYSLVRGLLQGRVPQQSGEKPALEKAPGHKPSVNVLGPSSLGFRCRDDVREVCELLRGIGVEVNVVAPLGASPHDLLRLPEADANICLYPEVAGPACDWLARNFHMPTIKTVPIGVGATGDFLKEVADTLGIEAPAPAAASRLPWYSRSVDSTYLTGKRVFIFADATHAIAAARIAHEELAFEVVGLGTYSREQARGVRSAAKELGLDALISDNYLEVERAIADAHPELVLGTQMERHIAKRLGIPCAVISTPAHVQDYPARYSPQMGYEGANVIFDTWVHPLMMGLEEHLLAMFRDDFEFNDTAPSHLHGEGVQKRTEPEAVNDPQHNDEGDLTWDISAEKELRKIPFFVRGKARRNTERFAVERGVSIINVDTLYEAKAHFSR
ncbi:MAG: ferredoxin:protochlorophyllide reductase (ATP-dependent) subunit B [Halieaceae bacterium]|jgi:light-independent protochlorophyllide reductase subunit B|nr:ferredoxin:protochlorophyllide reductase (ATP-dependent) subunit B [Halieaceae bacterium]